MTLCIWSLLSEHWGFSRPEFSRHLPEPWELGHHLPHFADERLSHLPNHLALKMDGAGASGPYPAVAGSRRGARGTGAGARASRRRTGVAEGGHPPSLPFKESPHCSP